MYVHVGVEEHENILIYRMTKLVNTQNSKYHVRLSFYTITRDH